MSPSVARNALKGVLLIVVEEIKININEISDLIRDGNYVDFNRIEIYFKEEAWLECLKVHEQKKRSKWLCSTCQNIFAKYTDSLVCERCLKWCHLSCTNLKKTPKLRNCVELNYVELNKVMDDLVYNFSTISFLKKTGKTQIEECYFH